MDFSIEEEERQIIESAVRFAQELREGQRRHEKDGVPGTLASRYEELGLAKLHLSEVAGGLGLSFRLKAMVLEELAFGDAAATLALEGPVLAATALGAVPRLEPWLQRTLDTKSVALFFDGDGCLTLTPERTSGSIPLVLGSPKALLIESGGRLSLVTQGFQAKPVAPAAFHAMGACSIKVDGRPELVASLDANEARALRGAARLYLAALLVGMARASYEHARRYDLERETFGKKVAHHQAIAFLLVDMAIAVDAARLLVQKAAAGLYQGNPDPSLAHEAFLQAAEAALFVTDLGVQLLGGHGYMKDHPVEKWMREARALTLLAGGQDGAREDAAAALALSLGAPS